jgi:hypothetical protein
MPTIFEFLSGWRFPDHWRNSLFNARKSIEHTTWQAPLGEDSEFHVRVHVVKFRRVIHPDTGYGTEWFSIQFSVVE